MIRKPVASGLFYEANEQRLIKQIEQCIGKVSIHEKEHAKGIVSPHAGFVYSGKIAASLYSRIKFPKIFVIIGPNHTGLGKPCAVYSNGIWQTPLGDIKVNSEFAQKILSYNQFLEEDDVAHLKEHSIEVQLPFIQYFKKDTTIVPICIGISGLSILQSIGESIAKAAFETNEDVVIISSSDMTHYESLESAKSKDNKAIDAILKLDEVLLDNYVRKFSISMCGFAPTCCMITACKKLHASKSELVKYTTSAEETGDTSSVVGYAGILVK